MLADGDYSWNAEKTELTVKINPAAKWSDGAAVTANDVKRTFDVGLEIGNPSTFHPYISEIAVTSDTELVIKANLDNLNPFMLEDFLSGQYNHLAGEEVIHIERLEHDGAGAGGVAGNGHGVIKYKEELSQ